MAINRRRRTAKVIELIGAFTRNVAFLRAARNDANTEWIRPDTNYWRTVTNNNIDIAVLDWCKLFVGKRGKHHWTKVVTDAEAFNRDLLQALRLSEQEFSDYLNTMAEYRDKWVAHMDLVEEGNIPSFANSITAARKLHNWIVTVEFPILGQAAGNAGEFDQVWEEQFAAAREVIRAQ